MMSINEVGKRIRIRRLLMAYDSVIFLLVVAFMVSSYGTNAKTMTQFVATIVASLICLLFCRIVGNVTIW